MGRDRLFAAVGVAVMLLSALAPTGLAASAAAQAGGDLEVGWNRPTTTARRLP